MKHPVTIIHIFLLFISACGNEKITSNTAIKKDTSASFKLSCRMQEKPGDGEDPVTIKTCNYGSYAFVQTGHADYKGRYSHEYEIFRLNGSKETKISNGDIFNEKLPELEKKVNAMIRHDYEEMISDPEAANCFEGFELKNFSIGEMGIIPNERNEMEFHVTFGLGGACMSVDGTYVTIKLNELKEYLK